jgi:hypothetical protein
MAHIARQWLACQYVVPSRKQSTATTKTISARASTRAHRMLMPAKLSVASSDANKAAGDSHLAVCHPPGAILNANANMNETHDKKAATDPSRPRRAPPAFGPA